MKAFRVDFTFTVEEQASMYVIAEDAATASEGALEMVTDYDNAKIINVEEVKKPKKEEMN